jgi:hypothetical protein
LEKFEWYSLSERGDEQRLDKLEKKKASVFLNVATQKYECGNIEFLFRGDTKSSLAERLCRDSTAPLSKVASGLFFFGEKGKHFWESSYRRKMDEIDKRWNTVIQNIDDLSIVSFRQLLMEFMDVLELSDSQKFREINPEFCYKLKTDSGRKDIINKFEGQTASDKRWVRDLFIYVLHSFSNRAHKSYTPYVSTTPEFTRAKYFARGASSADGCVLCLFNGVERQSQLLRSYDFTSINIQKRLVKLGFPPIKDLFFEEEEVAFFGGIFPHAIFTLIDLSSKIAFWNPALFQLHLKEIKEGIWSAGFSKDQQDFEQLLRESTKYARGIMQTSNKLSEISPDN